MIPFVNLLMIPKFEDDPWCFQQLEAWLVIKGDKKNA